MKGQIVRFVLVGLLCTFVDAGLHYAVWFGVGLSRSVPASASGVAFGLLKALTYVCAVIVGFYANRRWTFKAEGSARAQAGRFLVVSFTAMCVNAMIGGAVNHAIGGRPGWFAGMLLGTAVATVISFTGHRRWTFAASQT